MPPKRTFRRNMKIEMVARYTAQGYSDTEIALVMGIHKVYVSMLRRTPEYIAIATQVNTGIIGDLDRLTKEDLETKQEELRAMLPEAMLAMRDLLYDKTNPRLRLEAAKEIMDREGTLAKVSKSEVKRKVEFDFAEHDNVKNDLLSMLQKGSGINPGNSLDEFVNSNLDPEKQKELHKILELEEMDIKTGIQ